MVERVWDRFLSESDKAHIAAGGHQRRAIGFGTRPALLYVDLYRPVFGDRREPLLDTVKTWPRSCGPAAWDALPHLQRLLAAAREAGIPVIHVTKLKGPGVKPWGARRTGRAVPKDPVQRAREERDDEIVDEVAPIPGEVVIRKSSPSAFWFTPLVAHLVASDIDTVIVGGESTSGCVRSSVVDSATNGFRTIVAEECVFDRHEACHAINLFDMHQKYADVLPLDEVIAYLASLPRGRRDATAPARIAQPAREVVRA